MRGRWALLLLGSLASCRCGGGEEGMTMPEAAGAASASASAPSEEQEIADDEEEEEAGIAPESDDASPAPASTRFRDAAPGVEGAPPDPACVAESGKELSFADVVVDDRCAIDLRLAKKLRARLEKKDGGAAAALRQEASSGADGRVTVRLVNTGKASVTLPLSFHNELPAFTALVEDDRHTVMELAPPSLTLRDPGLGNRARLARIVLGPGARAWATVTMQPTITKVLLRGATDPCKGADAATACAEPKLAKGHYVLHIGELLTDVEAGDPARVEWTW